MSIYDKITTAKDLILEVKAHGLSTKIEDMCRAQDIFGNSTVEGLEALATDNGRRDTNGTPDQFGSWSSGKEGTQKIFYQIIFTIWSWEEATKYYNEHSNPLYIEGRKAIKECGELNKKIESQNAYIEELTQHIEDDKAAINQVLDEKVAYTKELEEKDAEIIKLKARLYDLITEKEAG